MPKRSRQPPPVPGSTPFSISSQFTGPPFGHSLENAQLRHKLLQEMARHGGVTKGKDDQPAARKSPRGGRGKR